MTAKAALAGADVVGEKKSDKKTATNGTKRKPEGDAEAPAAKKNKTDSTTAAAGAKMDTSSDGKSAEKKKKSNHERLRDSQPGYYTHALDISEPLALEPKQDSNVKEAKVWFCHKQTDAEKAAKAPPRVATFASPLHVDIKPQGAPWGDWKTKNVKLKKNQNLSLPVNAKMRRDIRAYAWDTENAVTNKEGHKEDPHCAELLDVTIPEMKRRADRVFVQSGVFPDKELALYGMGWDEKKGDKLDYIIKNLTDAGKLVSCLYTPVAPKDAASRAGQPLHEHRRLQMVRAVCKPVFDDKRNMIMTDDLETKRIVDDLLKYRNALGQEMQLDPCPMFDMNGARLSGKNAIHKMGEVVQDMLRFCYVKDPNKGCYLFKCEFTATSKFRKATSSTIDAKLMAEYAAADIQGADSFADEEDEATAAAGPTDQFGLPGQQQSSETTTSQFQDTL